jgi:hypothetical protein
VRVVAELGVATILLAALLAAIIVADAIVNGRPS